MKRRKKKQKRDISDDYEGLLLLSTIVKKLIIENPFTYGTAQHFVYMLRGIIAEHNRLYYMWDSPVITDFEYDELLRKLRDYEARYPAVFHELSPSNVIGPQCLVWPPPGTYNSISFGIHD